MNNPLGPMPSDYGSMAASGMSAAGVAGIGMLGWASMAYGMQRMGTASRIGASIFDPTTMGLHGFTRGMRGVMRGVGLAPKAGFFNTMGGIGNLYARAGFTGVVRGVAGGAMGAAMFAAPTMAAIAGVEWAGSQVAIGASQYSQVAQTIRAIRPNIGVQSSFQSQDYGALRNVMIEYANQGANTKERFRDASQLLIATGMGQEYRDTGTTKEFIAKFKKKLSEVKTVAAALDTTLADAYTTMKQTSGMGMHTAADQASFTVGMHVASMGGVDRGTLMQVGLAGSQMASQFKMSRKFGAMRATGTTNALMEAARSGLVSSTAIQELTGMSLEQGAPNLSMRMMQAVPTAMQGELGQTVLSALMNESGQIDEDRLAQFRAGSYDWKKLRKMSRRNLIHKGFLARFSTNQAEMSGQLMSRMGQSELISKLGTIYGQQAGTDPITGASALTGLGKDELQMLGRVEGSFEQLQTNYMHRNLMSMGGQMREKLRGQMMSPGRLIGRLKQQLLGPIEKKLQDFGSSINEKVTGHINRYLDQMINLQTTQVHQAFDDMMNKAMRGLPAGKFEKGLNAFISSNAPLMAAGQVYSGSMPVGGGLFGNTGNVLSTPTSFLLDAGGRKAYSAASSHMGWGGGVPSKLGGMLDLSSAQGEIDPLLSFLTTPGQFAEMGGARSKMTSFSGRAWSGLWNISKEVGGGVGEVLGGYAGAPDLGRTVGELGGRGAALYAHPLGRRVMRLGSHLAWEPTIRGLGALDDWADIGSGAARSGVGRLTKYRGLGLTKGVSQLMKGGWAHLMGTGAVKGAAKVVKASKALPIVGGVVDTAALALGIGAGTGKAAGFLKAGAKLGLRVGGYALAGVSGVVEAYSYSHQMEAMAEYAGTPEGQVYLRNILEKKTGMNVQPISDSANDILGLLGSEYGKGAGFQGATWDDKAKMFVYGATVSVGEIFGGETYREAMLRAMGVTQVGDIEGVGTVRAAGEAYSVLGGSEQDRAWLQKRLHTHALDIMSKNARREYYPGEALDFRLNSLPMGLVKAVAAERGMSIRPGNTVGQTNTGQVVFLDQVKAAENVFNSYVERNVSLSNPISGYVQKNQLFLPDVSRLARKEGWTEGDWGTFNRLLAGAGVDWKGAEISTGDRGILESAGNQGTIDGLTDLVNGSPEITEKVARATLAATQKRLAKTKLKFNTPEEGVTALDLMYGEKMAQLMKDERLVAGSEREVSKLLGEIGVQRMKGTPLSEIPAYTQLDYYITKPKAASGFGGGKEEDPRLGMADLTMAKMIYQYRSRTKRTGAEIADRWKESKLTGMAEDLLPDSPARKALMGYLTGFTGAYAKGDEGAEEVKKLTTNVQDEIDSASKTELEQMSKLMSSDPLLQAQFGTRVERRRAIMNATDRRMSPKETLQFVERLTGVSVWSDLQAFEQRGIKSGKQVATVQSRLARQIQENYALTGETKLERSNVAYSLASVAMQAIAAKDKDERRRLLDEYNKKLDTSTRRPNGTEVSGDRVASGDIGRLHTIMGESKGAIEGLADLFTKGSAQVRLSGEDIAAIGRAVANGGVPPAPTTTVRVGTVPENEGSGGGDPKPMPRVAGNM